MPGFWVPWPGNSSAIGPTRFTPKSSPYAHFRSVAPHVSPEPNPASSTWSPDLTRPLRIASSSASGLDALDLFPYSSMLLATRPTRTPLRPRTEDGGRAAVRVIEDPGKHLGADAQHVVRALGRDEGVGDGEPVHEARARGERVPRDRARRVELVLDASGNRRERAVRR